MILFVQKKVVIYGFLRLDFFMIFWSKNKNFLLIEMSICPGAESCLLCQKAISFDRGGDKYSGKLQPGPQPQTSPEVEVRV